MKMKQRLSRDVKKPPKVRVGGIWVALAIFAITANAANAAESPAKISAGEAAVMPGGLIVKAQKVYVVRHTEDNGESLWKSAHLGFRHGNVSVRINIKNPTDAVQTLRAEMPFERRSSRPIGRRETLSYIAIHSVAPGADEIWDIPVPVVARLFTGFVHLEQDS